MEQARSLYIEKEVQFLGGEEANYTKYCYFIGLYPQSSSFWPFTYPLGSVTHSSGLDYYPCARYLELLALDQILSLGLRATVNLLSTPQEHQT